MTKLIYGVLTRPALHSLLAAQMVTVPDCRYGLVDPFVLLGAYLRRGREQGLAFHPHTEVTGFDLHGGRVRGVQTNRGPFSTETVVLASGAWTRPLGRLLGRTWQVWHVHGQALVTERLGRCLNNHLASTPFFEAMHDGGDQEGSGAVLAISQAGHGNILLGEAGRVTNDLGSQATLAGQRAIAAMVQRYLPRLGRVRVLRGWAAPVAFTSDSLPFFGPVRDLPGLILATAFKSTVIVTPLVGETVAQLVVEGRSGLDLTPFSPDREISRDP